MKQSKEIKIEILTEDDGYFETQVSIPHDPSWMDHIDEAGEISSAAATWCSDNGYSYETWDYLE